MPEQPPYCSQVLDHLGLVAGMCDELGIGDVIDHATPQDPEKRDLTVGEAVNAMVLNGLGFITQALDLVPRFFQNKPTYRLISPRVAPEQLNDDALGRALDTLYACGVTALYGLIAATAATRLALRPTSMHLDTTSFHVEGRYHSDEPAAEHVVPSTKGDSRDHGPDLDQVMLELIVDPQAGIPVLMQPLSGNSSDPQAFGQAIHAHINQLRTTYGATSVVADGAFYSDANLDQLAQTAIKWITRVPATVSDAQVALAQADPSVMAPLQAGYRDRELTSRYGGVEQRWVLLYSEARQPQAQRTADRQLRQQTDTEVNALTTLCRTTFACEADARQALLAFAQDLQGTFLATSTVRATPRYDKRGRPKKGVQPDQMVYHIDGALASSLAPRQAIIDQHSCFILAPNELDATQLTPQELLAGYKGQVHAERGFRFLKDPNFLASALYLKKPARIMALLMVMTVCLLVYAALEYRIRQALKDHAATFPDQKGKRIQRPTARGVLQYFVGRHLLCQAGQWPLVLNLTAEHQHWRRLLGQPNTISL
jgi:transposase